jgi:hypothetical protein
MLSGYQAESSVPAQQLYQQLYHQHYGCYRTPTISGGEQQKTDWRIKPGVIDQLRLV